jgi:hypothetical protein
MENNCDLICSGPSSNNIVIKTNKIIVANYSILNKSVNNIINNEKEIIWFIGPNYRYFENVKTHHLFTDCIVNLLIKPKILYVKFSSNKVNNQFIEFSKAIKNIFKDIEIYQYDYFNDISTGISSLHYCLNNFDKIYVSGIELGYEKTPYSESYNSDFSYLYLSDKYHTGKKKIKTPIHLKGDLKYLNNLNKNMFKKIIPNENSGLSKHIIKLNN